MTEKDECVVCSGKGMSIYPPDEEFPYTDRTTLPLEPPHVMHFDPIERNYPYHSHGLYRVGMPEMFINANSFGAPYPAQIINMVFGFFWLNPHMLNELNKKGEVEIDQDVIPGNDRGDPLMVRMVSPKFFGVRASWYGKDRISLTGFAQIYVKCDIHVLEDSYFKDQVKEN